MSCRCIFKMQPAKRAKLRSDVIKNLKDDIYVPVNTFPPSKLPTIKDVIQCMLRESNFKSPSTARQISLELVDHWLFCNVYPISTARVQKLLLDLINCFDKLLRYPKSKRGLKWNNDVDIFNQESSKLFDIFCDNQQRRSELEKIHRLRMAPDDYLFYEDQKSNRIGQCVKRAITPNASDIKFKERIDQHEKLVSTISENLIPSQEQEQSISSPSTDSTLDASEYSESELYDKMERNKTCLTNLAKICDRYGISDRAGAAIANATLSDYGIISNQNMDLAVDRSKLRRERTRCRNQAQEEDKTLFVVGFQIYFLCSFSHLFFYVGFFPSENTNILLE